MSIDPWTTTLAKVLSFLHVVGINGLKKSNDRIAKKLEKVCTNSISNLNSKLNIIIDK